MLKVAIIGLSNSGKTTIFNALTGQNIETTIYPTTSMEPNLGIVKVPDSRLERLSEIFKPRKTTHATVEYIDYLGITKGDIKQNRKVFDLIKDVDAVVHVIRAFEDDRVLHPLNTVKPIRDLETVELELIFGDLELIEKRLQKIEEVTRKGKKPDEAEKKILLKCKESLEKEIPLRYLYFNKDEKRAMSHLQFISIKPEVFVLNIGEKDLNTDRSEKFEKEIEHYFKSKQIFPDPSYIPPLVRGDKGGSKTHYSLLSLYGKIEMEISRLSPEDASLFLDDLGIKEPASSKLIHLCYEILGLISFFTYVGDEVKAWAIPKGTNALKAAGKIHSDIERGFIKAEVISFDDFILSGSIHAAREKGLLQLEGKSYEVKDGDIINFRFNV